MHVICVEINTFLIFKLYFNMTKDHKSGYIYFFSVIIDE